MRSPNPGNSIKITYLLTMITKLIICILYKETQVIMHTCMVIQNIELISNIRNMFKMKFQFYAMLIFAVCNAQPVKQQVDEIKEENLELTKIGM